MGFKSWIKKVAVKSLEVGVQALAETAASGKPITLGNLGRQAAKDTVGKK